MKNLNVIVIAALIGLFVFKDQVLSYTSNVIPKFGVTQEDVDAKRTSIASLFNKAEIKVLGSSPDDPNPEPKPEPGAKCTECKGTGRIIHGDDHITECPHCDGDGVMELPKVSKTISDIEIEKRYNNLVGDFYKHSPVCTDESCEVTNLYE